MLSKLHSYHGDPSLIIFCRATGSLNINLTEIQQLGELWNSTTLNAVYNALVKRTKNANAGYLKGTRVFYANDYMVSLLREPLSISHVLTGEQVQRGEGYVSTLKMYSTRMKNTECTNSQNVDFNIFQKILILIPPRFIASRLPPGRRYIVHLPPRQ